MNRFVRRIGPVGPLTDELIEDIWADALGVLAESGVELLDGAACSALDGVGARVDGTRVRFDPDMVREFVAQAPVVIRLAARNPSHDVVIGGKETVAAPLYGATHVLDAGGKRRPGVLADLHRFHDLAQAAPGLQNSGANIVEPTDIAPRLRHLHTMRSVLTRTDKAFMPVTSSRDPEVSKLDLAATRGRDSLAMARIALGDGFDRGPAMVAVATCTQALAWSGPALQAIRLFAEAGQAVMLAPFAVAGQNAAPEPTALLTQITAEILAAAVYAQAVLPGAPLLFGPHFMLIGARGAKVSAGADTDLLIQASGQLARRAGLPFRAVGGLTGAKILDAQAGMEAEATLNASIAAGAHFLFHAAGWLDNGLTVSAAKFAFDCAALDEARRRQQGFAPRRGGAARAQLCGWGPRIDHAAQPGTAELLAEHYRVSEVADHRSWDAWSADGAPDAAAVADAAAKRMAAAVQPLPQDRIAALDDFIARRTRELG